MARLALDWLLVALVAVPPCADAGVIRGILRVPPERRAGAAATVPPARADEAVISLEGLPPKLERKFKRSRDNATILLTGNRIVPRVLPVGIGTRVRIQNRDRIYHQPFSVSPAKQFDLGPSRPGASQSVLFDHLGVVNLYCQIHPAMSGFVVVLPHGGFAIPDARGGFALPKLPPGTYRLRIWHPTRGEATREVMVPRRGDVSLDLSL